MVEVLLATYNGERFLAAQIESILGQDYPYVRLVARDDGSSDASVAIIRAYMKKYPGRVALLSDKEGNLGSARNFLHLLGLAQADYAMLADQDDVWLPDKTSVTLAAMRELEGRHGREEPLLVHTDLSVVDEDLSPLARSFWAFQHLDPRCDGIHRLLVQNVVTGCTVMVNRSLMNRLRPVPAGMIEHDWWLALLAASFGRIAYVAQPTLLYRQHGNNVVGAVKWDAWAACRAFFSPDVRKSIAQNLERTRLQAAYFLQMYEPLLARDVILIMSRYATLDRMNVFFRLAAVFRHRLFKVGLKRNMGMLWSLLFLPGRTDN